MTTLRVGAATDVGRRRQNNEDSLLITDDLFVVADGMGGHAGGEIASQTAVATLRDELGQGRPKNAKTTKAARSKGPREGGKARTVDDLLAAIRAANQAIAERADAEPGLRNMGTTATATALVETDEGEVLAVAHVGDSRAYLYRDGHLSQLTDDHSVPQELLRAGQLTEAEAAVDPRRNQITRVLGLGEPQPDIQTIVPYTGDRLLLCSDGLTNEVTDGRIAEILQTLADPQEAADRLVAMANENGGGDNITVVIVDVVDDDDRAATASDSLAAMGGLDREAPNRLLTSEERNARLRELARDDEGELPPSRVPGAAAAAASGAAIPPSGAFTEVDLPSRRITPGVVAFIAVVLLVMGLAAAAIGWYARGAYFVSIDEGRVTIFKGRPGGLLWFDPTVEERTDITEPRLLPAQVPALEKGKEEPSLAEARSYVRNLREEIEARAAATGQPSAQGTDATTTTTTTSPAAGP